MAGAAQQSPVAAIDCALIPPDAAGLPLPPDGQLLLFAAASVLGGARSVSGDAVMYVPAGTPTTERSFDGTWRDFYPQRQLRTLWRDLSWPDGHRSGRNPGQVPCRPGQRVLSHPSKIYLRR
jgi:hypothetical protein